MYITWICVLGCVSLVMQLGGFVTPRWLMYIGSGRLMELGIWYSCTSEQCDIYDAHVVGHGLPEMFSEITSPGIWLEFQIETSIGIVTAIIAVSLAWRWWITTIKLVAVLATLAFWASGIATWIPVGKVIKFYMTTGRFHSDGLYYSVVFSGIGATFALITAFLILVSVYTAKKQLTNKEYALHPATQLHHMQPSIQAQPLRPTTNLRRPFQRATPLEQQWPSTLL